MSRNKNNLAIQRMLISIAVLTFVCGSTESSPPLTPAPLTTDLTSPSDPADVTTTLLTQTATEAPRVSISFNDDVSSSIALSKELPPAPKTPRGPDLDIWYGEYFTDHKLPRLSASPLESEPSRLGVKLSFSF
jgi:hypothetical protein